MAISKFAYAAVSHPFVEKEQWANIRSEAKDSGKLANNFQPNRVAMSTNLVDRASDLLGRSFDPSQYLLTHATIVASVDVYSPKDTKTGSLMENGVKINRRYPDFRVKTSSQRYINSNGDAWSRPVLLKSFETFVGGHNFCFAPDTKVLMSNGTYKPIEEIQVGDSVISHTGVARAVTHKFEREFEGDIHSVNFDRFQKPVLVTGNHPFRAIEVEHAPTQSRANTSSKNASRYRESQVNSALRGESTTLKNFNARKVWVEASQLFEGVRVLGPEIVLGGRSEPDLAEFLGYYLAEGCLLSPHNDQGVVLSFGHHEQKLSERAADIAQRRLSPTSVTISTVETGIQVRVYSAEISRLMRHLGGHRASTKILAKEVFGWDRESLLRLLSSWLAGDGSLHGHTQRIRGFSVSKALVEQMQRIAELCGIKSSVVFQAKDIGSVASTVNLSVGGEKKSFGVISRHNCWILLISKGSTSEIISRSLRWDTVSQSRKRSEFAWWGGCRVHRVASNETLPYSGKVYNIEVEEDHSYVIDYGIAVHNCEHIQIEEQSKGRIIDAVARDIGDSIYIDILVATDKKHRDLIAAIQKGDMDTMSMGCFLPGTRVTMSDGTRVPIETVAPGDQVITHRGRARRVKNHQTRKGDWKLRRVEVDGVEIAATDFHPFFVWREDTASLEEVRASHLKPGDVLCLPEGGLRFSPITSIKDDEYSGEVYDLEVEEDHSYLVEGVAVHNCTIDGSICTKCGHWAADETEMCFPDGTRVLMADGRYTPIEEVVEGDLVLTHKGNIQPVLHTMSRHHEGNVTVLNVDGVPQPIRATTNHPFWVLRPEVYCQCGCGSLLKRTVAHSRGSVIAFKRQFLPGHNGKVVGITPEREMKMEFVPAKEINKGDYLAFPVPQKVENTAEATEDKARLLGYFLAEGSFIKREGERVGVCFSFGSHEDETLAAEVEQLLNRVWGQPERRVADFNWRDKVAKDGIKPIRRRSTSRPVPSDIVCPACDAPSEYAYNIRFKPGADDCYKCKVCARNWVESADRSVKAIRAIRGSVSDVRLMWSEAAEWFYHHCGEYSHSKTVPSEVMHWSPEIQKHILFGWLGGDGTQSRLGITGYSASFDLMSQMHVMAARCGWYSRKQVIFGRKGAILDDVVNGSGPVSVRDHNGWLPSFMLTIPEPSGFGGEIRFSDPENARVTLSDVTDGFRRVGDYLLYRVRDTWNECFSGRVNNIEVANDNSYVVEGLAVHNCTHVKYEKGATFYDDLGQLHKVAELCGHETIEPSGGVRFIEASWVETPAFKGAVTRNILTPNISAEKAEAILASPPPQWSEEKQMKAASSFLAGWDDEMGEEEEETPAESEPAKTPLEEAEDDIVQHLYDRGKKRVKDELKDRNLTKTHEDSASSNDSIQRDASLLNPVEQAIVRVASCDADLINSIAGIDSARGVKASKEVYRVALKVGPSTRYMTPIRFLGACASALGRKPSKTEAGMFLRLGRLMSQRGQNFEASHNNTGYKGKER